MLQYHDPSKSVFKPDEGMGVPVFSPILKDASNLYKMTHLTKPNTSFLLYQCFNTMTSANRSSNPKKAWVVPFFSPILKDASNL